MKLSTYHNVFFIGIGGIGMSAVARWFMTNDYVVYGYDKTCTDLTLELEQEGMHIHYEDSTSHIPQDLTAENTLVVYTPAVPTSHDQLRFFIEKGYDIKKRSETLGSITKDLNTIAVSGTHGKTTTSAILAHILKESGRNMTAFLGGIASNYGSNFVWNGIQGSETIAVVEADEYDRSFLRLYPKTAIVTSMDEDHLDIYNNSDDLRESFQEFTSLIPEDGKLIAHADIAPMLDGPQKESYGYSIGDSHIISGEAGKGYRVLISGDRVDLKLKMPGIHNMENAIAASIAAHHVGVSLSDIEKAVASFKGISRRFEIHLDQENCVFIDDYAHHPKELRAALQTAKSLYPNKKLTVVFQPHLYSRTRDFAPEFRESLQMADDLILLEIYPAREEPIPGITSGWLAEGLDCVVIQKDQLLQELNNHEIEVLLTVGAGDIDQELTAIKKHLSLKNIDHEVES